MLPFSPPSSRQDLVIEDPIYSPYPIRLSADRDAVLIDLIRSPTFERLRSVGQHGISALSGHLKGPRVTRYDHSIGAALMVRLLGATMEEQIAALLHDIAHTALSHVIDSVFNRVIHEEDKLVFLEESNIPSIIHAHGFDADRVLNEDNFSLLERPSPNLCADRCDYGIRDSVNFGIISDAQAHMIFADLVDHDGEIMFQSPDLARLFSLSCPSSLHQFVTTRSATTGADYEASLRQLVTDMEADRKCWSAPTHSLLYIFAADAIREALKVGQLTHSSLWSYSSDDAFWSDMVNSPHESVRILAKKVTPHVEAKEISPPPSNRGTGQKDKNAVAFESKARTVDPGVVTKDGKSFARLSQIDPSYETILRDYRKSKKGIKYYTLVDGRIAA